MNKEDARQPLRLSRFADRLVSKVATVSNTRERYAMPLHAHDCDMLFVPLGGRFEIVDTDARTYGSAPGHFVWFAAGAPHATTAQTLRQTHLAVYMDPDFWAMTRRANGTTDALQGMWTASRALQLLSRSVLEAEKGADMAAHCGALIMEAARLSAAPALKATGTPSRWIAELLAEGICVELSRPLAELLPAFADRQRLSRRQVERLFKSAFGVSPLVFQQLRRIERAKHLLESTDESVLSVAQQVGWESGSYLSRRLGREWGLSAKLLRLR
jgi:AraC-like DNA-binding protein